MDDLSFSFTIGHHETNRALPITSEAVASAHASGYDVLTTPITTPHFHTRVLALLSNQFSDSSTSLDDITSSRNASPIVIPPLAPADTPLTPNDTISQLVGVTASWIDLESPDPIIADVSRQVLRLELAYAAFCGLTYVVIPGPRIRANDAGGSGVVQYAHAILEALSQGPYMTLYVWLPMIDHSENQKEQMGDLAPFARNQYLSDEHSTPKKLDLFGTWQAWDTIRSICRYSTRLCVGADVFVKNPKGYPVLSKAHQALVFRFVYGKQPAAWFILSDVGPVPKSDARVTPSDLKLFPPLAQASTTPQIRDSTAYLSYLRNLQTRGPQRSAADAFGAGYQDYLQAPLQPLTVNLESITYEVFEKDPIKYEWYERAVARALHDWIEQGKPTSNPDGRVVVAVVGAGRGPLVTRALQASDAVGVEIDMWALEKNPNAFLLLQRHNETTWNRKVNLVKSDMRTWRGPVRQGKEGPVRKSYNLDPEEEEEAAQQGPDEGQQQTDRPTTFTGSTETDATYLLATAAQTPSTYKIDILISELLGSFADNELSPECLDGVQHLLNPTHGISIPASYTAHITPIAAPKLHADISLNMINTMPNAAEVPYVVMFNTIDYLSTEVVTVDPGQSQSSKQTQSEPESRSPTQPKTQSWSTVAKTASKQPQHQRSPSTASSSSPPPVPTPVIETTWSFHHPNHSVPQLFITQPNPLTTLTTTPSNAYNSRHSVHTFPIANRGTCHGIAGYFESVLYPGVELSTNPNTMAAKSEDMISWFPIYFPLKTPLHCPDASSLTIQMWRRTDDRKVWYEWIADVFITIEDSSGVGATQTGGRKAGTRTKKVRVGGSELHSSEKEGCLM